MAGLSSSAVTTDAAPHKEGGAASCGRGIGPRDLRPNVNGRSRSPARPGDDSEQQHGLDQEGEDDAVRHELARRRRPLRAATDGLPQRPAHPEVLVGDRNRCDTDTARSLLRRGDGRADETPRRRAVRARPQCAVVRPAGVRRRSGSDRHGVWNVGGRIGTAASHGCVRLDTAAITWLGQRIGPGVPVTITN